MKDSEEGVVISAPRARKAKPRAKVKRAVKRAAAAAPSDSDDEPETQPPASLRMGDLMHFI